MLKNSNSSGNVVEHFFRNGDDITSGTVSLASRNDQFTLTPRNLIDRDEIARQLLIIKEVVGEQNLHRLKKDVYSVQAPKGASAKWINKMMTVVRNRAPLFRPDSVYHPKGDKKSVYYLTSRIIVAIKPEIDPVKAGEIVDELARKYSLTWMKERTYKYLKNTYLFELNGDNEENPIKVANAIERDEQGNIDYVEPSLIRVLSNSSPPAPAPATGGVGVGGQDSFNRKQWYLDTVNVPEAWRQLGGKGRASITIAVIDLFFMTNHPAIANQITSRNFDLVDPENPFQDLGDDHGTSCAGIVGAISDSPLISGIAPGCSLVPVRISERPSFDDLLDVGEKIGPIADIISFSLSPESPNNPLQSRSLQRQIASLASSGGPKGTGILFCVSAGNFNLPVSGTATVSSFIDKDGIRRTLTDRNVLNPLAAHPGVMAIAACKKSGDKARYSNFGTEISVCGPGSDILPFPRNRPNERAKWIFTTGALTGELDDGLFTNRFGGTSSSAPIVAAVAALVLSANDRLTAAQLRLILENSADKINITSRRLVGRRGEYRDDGQGRMHSDWFGYGRINALQAVTMATRLN